MSMEILAFISFFNIEGYDDRDGDHASAYDEDHVSFTDHVFSSYSNTGDNYCECREDNDYISNNNDEDHYERIYQMLLGINRYG